MGTITGWHPSWWTQEVHGRAWDRVKGAMQHDWSQDGLGAQEVNRTIPGAMTQADPPKVLGTWSEAEIPYGYGYAARRQFGSLHPLWTPELETQLGREWRKSREHAAIDWSVAKRFVRRAYDYDEFSNTWPGRSCTSR